MTIRFAVRGLVISTVPRAPAITPGAAIEVHRTKSAFTGCLARRNMRGCRHFSRLNRASPDVTGCSMGWMSNPSAFALATLRPSVYVGYNWQIGSWVVGAEADAG